MRQFAQFHRIAKPSAWNFSADEAILFLRHHRDQKTPAWKRVRIAEALIDARRRRKQSTDDLIPILRTLQDVVRKEKAKGKGNSSEHGEIEESVGRIDPREPDVIQNLRRSMRSRGMAYNTEKAYVKWVRRFMRDRDLTCQSDFAKIGEREIESFLTDLAVDGDVSDSTQNQATMIYTHAIARDLDTVVSPLDRLLGAKSSDSIVKQESNPAGRSFEAQGSVVVPDKCPPANKDGRTGSDVVMHALDDDFGFMNRVTPTTLCISRKTSRSVRKVIASLWACMPRLTG